MPRLRGSTVRPSLCRRAKHRVPSLPLTDVPRECPGCKRREAIAAADEHGARSFRKKYQKRSSATCQIDQKHFII